MSDFSDMIQGRMQNRKVQIKGQNIKQLDLFASLSEREHPVSAPKTAPPPRQEVELVLPPPGTPPDVVADVRAALSESGQRAEVVPASPGPSTPPLRTGIYHRPRRPAPPSAAIRPRTPLPGRFSCRHVRDWFSGVELNRRHVSLVILLIVLVAAVAFWTACPRRVKTTPGVLLDLKEATDAAVRPVAAVTPVEATPGASPAQPSTPAAPQTPAATGMPAAEWNLPGMEATRRGQEVYIQFTAPIFVSTDRISVEGMKALKTLAGRLQTLQSGARVVVTGHTDDVPLSRPTPQFQNNADLAAARARAALEHLAQFTRANPRLTFEPRTGEPAQAPYPNDTPQNRRLNRTVTVQVAPAP